MPTTTRQMAKIAGISEQTVRNYTRDYAELLSPKARGDMGARLFDDQDVRTLCTVASLRKEDVPPVEVIERVRAGDIVISPTPQQATPSPQQATETPQPLALAHSDLRVLQSRFAAMERTQALLLRGALLWGALLGAIGAFVVAAFLVWVLWLFGAR